MIVDTIDNLATSETETFNKFMSEVRALSVNGVFKNGGDSNNNLVFSNIIAFITDRDVCGKVTLVYTDKCSVKVVLLYTRYSAKVFAEYVNKLFGRELYVPVYRGVYINSPFISSILKFNKDGGTLKSRNFLTYVLLTSKTCSWMYVLKVSKFNYNKLKEYKDVLDYNYNPMDEFVDLKTILKSFKHSTTGEYLI